MSTPKPAPVSGRTRSSQKKTQGHPYELAARSALNKHGASAPKRVRTETTTSTSTPGALNNDDNMDVDAPTKPKSLTPTSVKNAILQSFGLSSRTEENAQPTAPPQPVASTSITIPPVNVQLPNNETTPKQSPMTFAIPLTTRFAAYTKAVNIKGKTNHEKV